MSFPPVAQLVPHAEPMILIDALTAWSEGRATSSFVVRAHAPFVVDGTLSVPATIEHMAQTVAACLGYEAFLGGAGVRVGMIIACRRFKVHVPTLHVGEAVTIDVARVRGNDTLSHFDCEARRGETVIAAATLTLFHGAEPPEASR